ncbi:hypothetical protein A2U01_0100751 [Trifolium medium]|uniref:Uncharacterized protein n=1 Tax=Trifolium medium TaxID=97028 RepID=A0A392UZB5_9FABA|nr:hypothetical protein [Trifolium medium]
MDCGNPVNHQSPPHHQPHAPPPAQVERLLHVFIIMWLKIHSFTFINNGLRLSLALRLPISPSKGATPSNTPN